MKAKDKFRLTATKMAFMRYSEASNCGNGNLHHFCSPWI